MQRTSTGVLLNRPIFKVFSHFVLLWTAYVHRSVAVQSISNAQCSSKLQNISSVSATKQKFTRPSKQSNYMAVNIYFQWQSRADPSQDHSRALWAAINRPPAELRRQTSRPRRTWLGIVELDVRQCNIGLHSAWQCAQDRRKWQKVVETATRSEGYAT